MPAPVLQRLGPPFLIHKVNVLFPTSESGRFKELMSAKSLEETWDPKVPPECWLFSSLAAYPLLATDALAQI